MEPTTERGEEWRDFACEVMEHIESYTVPQYGDYPNDQLVTWEPNACIESIKRYCNRFNSNARGKEEVLRDMLKVAHYACITYFKVKEELDAINKPD